MTDEDRRKHLELVQAVITRQAGNSFAIKTWAVTLITILAALATKDGDIRLAIPLLLPAVCFWGLDAYYLRQERLFRKLYGKIAAQDALIPPFSMDTRPVVPEVDKLSIVAWSPTVRWLHLPILILVFVVIGFAALKYATGTKGVPQEDKVRCVSVPGD
jgi:hypothetical protein